MSKFTNFWSELKRRKVFRSLAVYAAAAFIILEVGDIVLPGLGLPQWTVSFMIILLILGFPATILIAWIYDVTSQGIRRTADAPLASDVEVQEDDPQEDPDHSGVDLEDAGSKKKVHRIFNLSNLVTAALAVTVCVLLALKIFKRDRFEEYRDEKGHISLAVLPFENLTADSSLNYLEKGLSSYLSNALANSDQLSVIDEQSVLEQVRDFADVNQAGFSTSNNRKLASSLNSRTYLSGNFQGNKGQYMLMVDLTAAESGEKLWSAKIKGNLESTEYFDLADSLACTIRDYLEIQVMKEEVDRDHREAYTASADAYREYISGMSYLLSDRSRDAIQAFEKALEYDPEFTLAKFYIAWAHAFSQRIDSSGIWTARAYEDVAQLPVLYRKWLRLWHAAYVIKDINEVRRQCRDLMEMETESRFFWFDLGVTQFYFLEDLDNARDCFERVEKISKERGTSWKYQPYYEEYARLLHQLGEHKREMEINQLGQELNPGVSWLQAHEAACLASLGKWDEFNQLFVSFHKFWDERSVEPQLREYLTAQILYLADLPDSVHQHYKRRWELAPDNPYAVFTYGRNLINQDRDVKKGIELLESISDYPGTLSTYYWALGRGYQKLEQYEQAMKYLALTKESYPNANRNLDSHIEACQRSLDSIARLLVAQ